MTRLDRIIFCIQHGGRWKDPTGFVVGAPLFDLYREMQTLLWGDRCEHNDWSDLMLRTILGERITTVYGPHDCIAGHTRLFDPTTGNRPTIKSLCDEGIAPVVMTLKGPRRASVPFIKGHAPLFEVVCSDGSRFTGTASHRVFSVEGFVPVSSLRIGARLRGYDPVHLESTLESCSSTRVPDGRRLWKTNEGSQFGYPAYFGSYGGQLLLGADGVSGVFPSPADAPIHGFRCERTDDPAHRSKRNRHHQEFFHPSISGSCFRSMSSKIHGSHPLSEAAVLSGSLKYETLQRFVGGSDFVPEPFSVSRSGERGRLTDVEVYSCGDSTAHWIEVQSITSVGIGDFYDLYVPGPNHYFAEGAIHHNSGKTHVMARYALCDYFCFPRDTLILMSSTDLRGLELRVWGEVKDLYNLAKETWPEAPGIALDSMHGIFTDELVEGGDARDIRRGLICIPVLDSDNQWKGIQKWVGVKQKRRRMLADETQFYAMPFLDTLANINKQKSDFKGVFGGNPIGENDPLDKLGEPVDGWDNLPEITKTTTWRNKHGGVTIQLLGSDSPAIRFPGKYSYLIDQSDLDYIEGYWGRESSKWFNQGLGVRRPGIDARRVVTQDMVRKFKAQEDVVWGPNATLTKVYAVDAGYGGDRCIGGEAEFGMDINGKQVLNFHSPRLIPVRLFPKDTPPDKRILPEDQIAEYVKADCERLGIPCANVFHDSTGRGSLGTAFARIWRSDTNPVEFGSSPTARPVMSDLFIYDEKLKQRRLERCDEHYSKRVSELHYSVRYTIESRQMRGLTNSVRDELCVRMWDRVRGNKVEVESKEDTKERLGRSPDEGDWAAIIVEGARQRGFFIARMEGPSAKVSTDERWKDKLRARERQLRSSYTLTYS